MTNARPSSCSADSLAEAAPGPNPGAALSPTVVQRRKELQNRLIVALLLLYGLFRFPRLSALPIFVDESFYIHWAELVRGAPTAEAFVSLIDPKPPFHIWLLALLLPLGPDPLWAGRLLSAAAGAVTVVLLFPLCRLLGRLARPATPDTASGLLLPAVSALFLITCPYLAFYQRLALAEALVVLESVAVVWLSLAIAQAAWTPGYAFDESGRRTKRGMAWYGIALGVLLGLAMLTRQNFSYLLWFLPLMAFLAWPRPATDDCRSRPLRRFLHAALLTVPVAVTIWIPMLVSPPKSEIWKRIFYQARFLEEAGPGSRVTVVLSNAAEIFLPLDRATLGGWRVSLEAGWFWTYLTPPICVLVLAAFCWLAARGRWRLVAFLVAWFVLTSGPLAVFGRILFSRYAVPATIPLLLAAAAIVDDVLQRASKIRRLALHVSALVGLLAMVAWPVTDTLRQIVDWKDQRFIPRDRWQYVHGWPAGPAVRQAVKFVEEAAETGPLTVVNMVGDAFPNLAVAVFFHDDPRVSIYHTEWVGLISSLRDSWPQRKLNLRRDYRRSTPTKQVSFPKGGTILCISPDPAYWLEQSSRTVDLVNPYREYLEETARFENPPYPGAAGQVSPAIVIYRLKT